MDSNKWKKIEQLCFEAEGLDDADRDTYLKSMCGSDEELLTEVKKLLTHSDSSWLQEPLVRIESSFVFSEDNAVSDTMIGPYRLIRTIATGGMGQVYLAVRDDDQFERFVALKVVKKGMVSEAALARFYEERQILASLNHPHIARLFDGGTDKEGIPWFAMEFIEGIPITEYCEQYDINKEAKIDLFLSVCSAVQYAHQNLVIHRDLKPGNILITAEGIPKLLDFGIAKFIDLDQHSSNSGYALNVMTPEYASPEQLRREAISTVSDIYSLGVLLYELLAGKHPYLFEERSPEAIEQAVCHENPPHPSDVSAAGLDKDLCSIIMKALEKNPADRYASVEQLSTDLHRYNENFPVRAYDDSFVYRSRKFIRRNKWGVAATALIFLLVSIFSTVTYLQSKTIEARADEAVQQRDRAEQVSNFLTDLFESVDPSLAKDKALTAIELLHRGVNRIETELRDQPQTQANLYLVISDVYESLGLFDEGLDLAKEAYALQKALMGPSHAEIARSLNAMGWLYHQKGEFEEADSLLTASLGMRKNLLGSGHLDVAHSLNDLAVLRQSQGDYEATDTLLAEAIAIRKDQLGDQHESVAVALSNYAALKWRMGDLHAAESRMKESLSIFQATLDNLDMRTAIAMTNLAAIRLSQQKTEGVEELYKDALQIRLKLLGDNHPDVANSYAHLGNYLRANGNYKEAEAYLLQSLKIREQIFGKEHVQSGDNLRLLGYLYEAMHNFGRAESYYREAIRVFSTLFPNGHTRTANVLHLLGELYLDTDKVGKAEQPLREAFDQRKQYLGENDPRTLDSMINLGMCLEHTGKKAESRILLLRALNLIKQSGKEHKDLRKLAEKTLGRL